MIRALKTLALRGSYSNLCFLLLFIIIIIFKLDLRSQRPVGRLSRNFAWWSEVALVLTSFDPLTSDFPYPTLKF